jgi:hypothetical protein
MLKPYSTKRPRPIPVEFEQNFIEGGWSRVNHMFGKNPAVRYFTALGSERLRIARLAAVRKQREADRG